MKKIKIEIPEIKKTLISTLLIRGLTRPEATTIASEYLDGELQGKPSHGLMAFPSLIKKLKGRRKKHKILKKTHSVVYIDANENLGTLVGKTGADIAIKMAKSEGIGLAAIKNMITWLRPGIIAQYVADSGNVGFIINNGGKSMTAPPGGFDPVIGTNPIGIGIPTAKDPIVADMATSVRAWGEVRKAIQAKQKLPKNHYYTKTGQFAIDPNTAYSALAMGDYKGFALGMMIEILTGSFLGRNMGKQSARGDYRVATRGGLIIVLNPKFFGSSNKFKQANSQLIKEIKGSRKLKKGGKIFVPGERAASLKKQNMKKGALEVDQKLWSQLTNFQKKDT